MSDTKYLLVIFSQCLIQNSLCLSSVGHFSFALWCDATSLSNSVCSTGDFSPFCDTNYLPFFPTMLVISRLCDTTDYPPLLSNVGYFFPFHSIAVSLCHQCWLPLSILWCHRLFTQVMSQAVHQSDVTSCSPEWCHQVFTRVMSPGVHQSDVTRCSPEWCHQVFIPVPRAGFITASADVTCSGTSWRRKVVYLGCFSTKPSTLHVSIARLDPCCHPFICSPQPSTLPPSLCPVSITCFHIFNLSPFPSPAVGLSNSPPSNFVELLPVFY